MKEYQIGTFADMIGVTVQTLRNWDKSGKLSPHRVSVGGTRYYSYEQFKRYTQTHDVSVKQKAVLYVSVRESHDLALLSDKVIQARNKIDSSMYDVTVVTDILSQTGFQGFSKALREVKSKSDVLFIDRSIIGNNSYFSKLLRTVLSENQAALEILDLDTENGDAPIDTETASLDDFDSLVQVFKGKLSTEDKSRLVQKIIEMD